MLLSNIYYSVSLATFPFLMSWSSNGTWGFKRRLECGARERIEFKSISWGFQEKINLHPLSLAAICGRAEHVIPVVKLENEVITYGSECVYCLMLEIWCLVTHCTHQIWRKVNSGFFWKEKNEFEDILWIVTLNLVDLLYIFLTTLGNIISLSIGLVFNLSRKFQMMHSYGGHSAISSQFDPKPYYLFCK